jgi:hypothetical protein
LLLWRDASVWPEVVKPLHNILGSPSELTIPADALSKASEKPRAFVVSELSDVNPGIVVVDG